MAKKYTTGTVSKMMGITRQALRFYEKKDLVRSSTDEEAGNEYHYYERRDLSHLIRAKYLQSFGFSLSEVAQASLGQWSRAQWLEESEKQCQLLSQTLQREQQRLKALQEHTQLLRSIDALGTYKRKKRPALFYYCHSDSAENLELENDLFRLTQKMIALFPTARYAFVCSRKNLKQMDTLQINGLSWGLTLPCENGAVFSEEERARLDLFPAADCLYTVTALPANYTAAQPANLDATATLCKGVYTEALARGYRVSADATGAQIGTFSTENGPQKLYEIYLPVKR